MGSSEVILALATVFLMNIVVSNSAPPGTGSVIPKDTDQVSALREKLIRLNQLLSSVDEDEEADLKTVAGQKEGKENTAPIKSAISEYMGSGKQAETAPAQKESSDIQSEAKSQLADDDDDSIRILSKALARLRQPKYSSGDSTGEALSTLYNEPHVEDKNTEEMEHMIERALTRLNQDKVDNTQDQPLFGSTNKKYDLPQEGLYAGYYGKEEGSSRKSSQPTEEDNQLREEAIRVVEARLMQDIVLANKLGISVEDLIEDLDDKAFRDAKLKKIEQELDSFQLSNARY